MKYSVLTFNIGGYELIHEIPQECINEEIEYVFVTDDHSIKSDSWTVVYADDLTGSTFDKVFQVRYNPFKYVHTDTVMKIDGSMGIVRDVMPIFEYFDKYGYIASVMIHPTRRLMVPEYEAWIRQRGYPIDQANKCLNVMIQNGYDLNYQGLYQYNFMIQRNDDMNNTWNKVTYETMQKLAMENETVDRLDQTIGSFILNKFFSDQKIMPVGQYLCDGLFFDWYMHGTNNKMDCNDRYFIEPFLFNKSCYLACLY